MGMIGFQRARRLAAERLGQSEPAQLAYDEAIALCQGDIIALVQGETIASDLPSGANPQQSTERCGFALERINQAAVIAELLPIPAIGKGAATRILNNRPEGGYESLEQVAELNSELSKSPFNVDWAKVKAWEG